MNFANAEIEEARACLFGIQAVGEAGYDNLIIEGDCLQLIQKLRSSQPLDNFVGLLVQDIQAYARRFSFLSWSYVKRGGNKVAHDMAHMQPFSLIRRLWVTDFPDSVSTLASKDMYAHISSNII